MNKENMNCINHNRFISEAVDVKLETGGGQRALTSYFPIGASKRGDGWQATPTPASPIAEADKFFNVVPDDEEMSEVSIMKRMMQVLLKS